MKPFFIELKGTKKFKRLLKDAQGFKAGLVVLKSQESIGLHSTEEKKELIVVLQGKAKIYYGKRKALILKEQALIFLPPRTPHNVENIAKGLLKYVYITIAK